MTKMNSKKGFTLAELLVTIAIITALMAISVPAVFTIRKNLRQKELDTKAETLYMAVQNRLSELYASGNSDTYNPARYPDSMTCLNGYPGDYDATDNTLNEDSVYYIISGDNPAASAIVTDSIVDSDLKDGNWVIEIIPYQQRDYESDARTLTAGLVYGVYYSEDLAADLGAEYQSGLSENGYSYISEMRDKSVRLEDGARVGYYGGKKVETATSVSSLSIDSVTIHSNAEVLTATVKAKKPDSGAKDLALAFKLSDEYGNSFTVYYDGGTGRYYTGYNSESHSFSSLYTAGNISLASDANSYIFTITMDDLSSDATRFYSLYGAGSGHNMLMANSTSELVSGSEITLDVTFFCPSDMATTETAYASDTGSSLFARTSTVSDDGKADIYCGRHLQNLDEGSHVDSRVTSAVQINNIDLSESGNFCKAYGSAYYNGVTSYKNLVTGSSVSAPNFESITNQYITSYTGGADLGSAGTRYAIKGITINTADGSAGLFASLGTAASSEASAISLKNITMTGARVSTSNAQGAAGALVGTISDKIPVMITGCQVYLSKDSGDIPDTADESANYEAYLWISGTNAGGLVGVNGGNLIIMGSSASTVIGSVNAGGLVGSNAGTVALAECYSDSYIYGDYVGGLIGSGAGSTSLVNCYSAGFAGLNSTSSEGAGLVDGLVTSLENSYTVLACYKKAADGGINREGGQVLLKADGTYYSTAKSASGAVSSVYYYNAAAVTGYDLAGSAAVSYLTAEQLGDAFSTGKSVTQAYKLLGQSLTAYSYPALNTLNHYGDWQIEYHSGGIIGLGGLSGSYNEAEVTAGRSAYIWGTDITGSATLNRPKSESDFFIYDTDKDSLLSDYLAGDKGVTLKLEATSSYASGTVLSAALSNSLTYYGEFRCLTGKIYYVGSGSISDVVVTATFTRGEETYVLSIKGLTAKSEAATVTFYAGGDGAKLVIGGMQYDYYKVELSNPISLTDYSNAAKKAGYVIDYWTDQNGKRYEKNATIPTDSGDLTLTASYTPVVASIKLVSTSNPESQTSWVIYGDTTLRSTVTKPSDKTEGTKVYTFDGWYTAAGDAGVLAVDSAGKVYSGLTALLEAASASPIDITLYAHYTEVHYTLTLKYFGGPEVYTINNGDTTLAEYDYDTTGEKYLRSSGCAKLLGWYTADGTKVLNANGNIVNNSSVAGYTSHDQFALTENKTLYAKYSRAVTIYERVTTNSPSGQYYLVSVTSGNGVALTLNNSTQTGMSGTSVTVKTNGTYYTDANASQTKQVSSYYTGQAGTEWKVTPTSGKYTISSGSSYIYLKDNLWIGTDAYAIGNSKSSNKTFTYGSDTFTMKSGLFDIYTNYLGCDGSTLKVTGGNNKQYVYLYQPATYYETVMYTD